MLWHRGCRWPPARGRDEDPASPPMRQKPSARVSCNPAIGGIGKKPSGQNRRFGRRHGAMAADKGGIQFRVLNSAKALPYAPLAPNRSTSCTKRRFRLENQANLWIFQQTADDLIVRAGQSAGRCHPNGPAFHGRQRGADHRHLGRTYPHRPAELLKAAAGDPPSSPWPTPARAAAASVA